MRAAMLNPRCTATLSAKAPRQVHSQVALSSGHSAFYRGSGGAIAAVQPVVQVATVETDVIECAAKGKGKTRKAAAKRFKITGGGKVMHRHRNKQHLNEKKRRKRLLTLEKEAELASSDLGVIRKCMPYAKLK